MSERTSDSDIEEALAAFYAPQPQMVQVYQGKTLIGCLDLVATTHVGETVGDIDAALEHGYREWTELRRLDRGAKVGSFILLEWWFSADHYQTSGHGDAQLIDHAAAVEWMKNNRVLPPKEMFTELGLVDLSAVTYDDVFRRAVDEAGRQDDSRFWADTAPAGHEVVIDRLEAKRGKRVAVFDTSEKMALRLFAHMLTVFPTGDVGAKEAAEAVHSTTTQPVRWAQNLCCQINARIQSLCLGYQPFASLETQRIAWRKLDQ